MQTPALRWQRVQTPPLRMLVLLEPGLLTRSVEKEWPAHPVGKALRLSKPKLLSKPKRHLEFASPSDVNHFGHAMQFGCGPLLFGGHFMTLRSKLQPQNAAGVLQRGREYPGSHLTPEESQNSRGKKYNSTSGI